jgi:SAM-dependent methyltransferase
MRVVSTRAIQPVQIPASRAFEELAEHYDDRFTHSLLGRLLRQAVWRRLDACFKPGSRILDLGCGTGEDAVYLARKGMHVVALDAAHAMCETARRKTEAAGVKERVEVRYATIESLADNGTGGTAADAIDERVFDGAFSNFGALNCCTVDLASAARGLARRLRPGAPLVLVVMGPLVPWEWIWFLARGEPRFAFRRLHPRGVLWRGATIRYPSIGTLRRAFEPAFRCMSVSGLGFLLPPSYTEGWALRHPRLIRTLDRWERRLASLPPSARLADHYLLELVRR